MFGSGRFVLIRRRRGAVSVNCTVDTPPEAAEVTISKASNNFTKAPKLGTLRMAIWKAGFWRRCFDAVAVVTFPPLLRKNLTSSSAKGWSLSLRVLSMRALPPCSIRTGPASFVVSRTGLTNFVK